MEHTRRLVAPATKLEREWHALRLVYRTDEFVSGCHEDSPDFVLQRRGCDAFGVEVTALYEHEADARIDAHPHYLSDLLAGGWHMHRDDLQILGASTVEIHDKDGNLKARDVPAILRPTPPAEVHSAAIAAVIDRKNERFARYERALEDVNLVIVDHFARPRGFGDEYNATELLTPELRRTLRETGFREVFLAAETPDGSWAIRPLQMMRLLEGFYLFLGALVDFDETPEDLSHDDVARLFVHAFEHRDLDLYFSGSDGERPYAVHRGAGIQHKGDDISILDFHDFPPPQRTPLPVAASPTA